MFDTKITGNETAVAGVGIDMGLNRFKHPGFPGNRSNRADIGVCYSRYEYELFVLHRVRYDRMMVGRTEQSCVASHIEWLDVVQDERFRFIIHMRIASTRGTCA